MVTFKKVKLSTPELSQTGSDISGRMEETALELVVGDSNMKSDEEVYPITEVEVETKVLSERQLLILLKHVTIGCKVFTIKVDVDNEKNEVRELRKAEVLSVRKNSYSDQKEGSGAEFYVHYVEFNKRLDEWVGFNRLDLSKPIEYPKGFKPPLGGVEGSGTIEDILDKVNPKLKADKAESPDQIIKKRDQLDGTYWDRPGAEDEKTSKRKELERLRTSGSMTQNIHEISRVKNLNKIQMGRYEVEAWYFSPYPREMAHEDLIYLCEFCLTPYKSKLPFQRHRTKCTLKHPPGNEIYRHGDISFFELDGRVQKKYCRWLCLLSKCFLDHKTLYYDVDPFLFYVMTLNDAYGCHMIGYFSKEKDSLDNYNLACILTLPQYQRKGYGKLLIQFSYELSKLERKLGSPEKPLSDLGLLSYRAYWTESIVELLLNMGEAEGKVNVSIEQISQYTSFTTQDVIHTLLSIGALRYYRNEYVIYLSDTVVDSFLAQRNRKARTNILPEKIQWKPPVNNNQPKYLN